MATSSSTVEVWTVVHAASTKAMQSSVAPAGLMSRLTGLMRALRRVVGRPHPHFQAQMHESGHKQDGGIRRSRKCRLRQCEQRYQACEYPDGDRNAARS